MKNMKKHFENFKNLFRNKKGQGMVEYGLIIGLVAVAVIALLTTMGGRLQTLFQSIVTALTGAGS